MTSFSESLEKCSIFLKSFETRKKTFISSISTKYDLNLQDVSSMFEEIIEFDGKKENISVLDLKKENIIVKKQDDVVSTIIPEINKSPQKKTSISSNNSIKCNYILTSGKNKGTQCTSKASVGNVCKKHVKSEEKKTSKLSVTKINSPKIIKKILSTQPTLTLKKNKQDRYEDPETNFIFNEEKKVIGRQVDGEIVQLTEKDIELCKLKVYQYVVPLLITNKCEKNNTNKIKKNNDDEEDEDCDDDEEFKAEKDDYDDDEEGVEYEDVEIEVTDDE